LEEGTVSNDAIVINLFTDMLQ